LSKGICLELMDFKRQILLFARDDFCQLLQLNVNLAL